MGVIVGGDRSLPLNFRELSCVETYKTLKKLNKFEDIKSFLLKIRGVFERLRLSGKHAGHILSINQLLSTVSLLESALDLKQLRREHSKSLEKSAFSAVKSAKDFIASGGITLRHAAILQGTFDKVQQYCEALNLCENSAGLNIA